MVNVVGFSATQAGVSIIPLSVGLVAGSIISGQLVSRLGRYKPFMLGGAAIFAVGAALLASMTAEVSYGLVMLYMVIVGIGIGPTLPLFPLAVQNAVPVSEVGQQATQAALGSIHTKLSSQATAVAEAVIGAVKRSFSTAIVRIYFYVVFVIVAGFIVTIFVPEISLRKTQE